MVGRAEWDEVAEFGRATVLPMHDVVHLAAVEADVAARMSTRGVHRPQCSSLEIRRRPGLDGLVDLVGPVAPEERDDRVAEEALEGHRRHRHAAVELAGRAVVRTGRECLEIDRDPDGRPVGTGWSGVGQEGDGGIDRVDVRRFVRLLELAEAEPDRGMHLGVSNGVEHQQRVGHAGVGIGPPLHARRLDLLAQFVVSVVGLTVACGSSDLAGEGVRRQRSGESGQARKLRRESATGLGRQSPVVTLHGVDRGQWCIAQVRVIREESMASGLEPGVPAGHLPGIEQERQRIGCAVDLGLCARQALHQPRDRLLQSAHVPQRRHERVPIERTHVELIDDRGQPGHRTHLRGHGRSLPMDRTSVRSTRLVGTFVPARSSRFGATRAATHHGTHAARLSS